MEQFQTNIGELTSELHSIHQRQDAEKRQLTELKTLLKQTIATYKEVRSDILKGVMLLAMYSISIQCIEQDMISRFK